MNSLDNKLYISYSFLAAINDSESNLLESVYIPICKRGISAYSRKNSFGKSEDIRNEISDIYGLTIPEILLRKLLKKIADGLPKKGKNNNFIVFENGQSFQIEGEFSYTALTEIEDKYQKQKQFVNQLEDRFNEFIIQQNNINALGFRLSNFISQNKNNLISYFAKNAISTYKGELSNTEFNKYAVTFLEKITRTEPELYETARKIYLGAIIASFLESGFDLEPIFENRVTYYLDTRLILKILDLENLEDTLPMREFLQVIKNTGGQLRILSVTLDELMYILRKSTENFVPTPLAVSVSNHSIVGACFRNGFSINNNEERRPYSKTELTNILENIESHLKVWVIV
jgi:hypothetical protein